MSPRQNRTRRAGALVVLAATATLVVACGDDDDETTATTESTTEETSETTAAADDDLEEFCALAEEINSQEEFPTVEQVEEYAAVAPDELDEPLSVLLEQLRAADGDFMAVFADEAGGAAVEEITVVEAELCGFDPPPGQGADQDASVTSIDPAATRVDVEASDYMFMADFPTTAGRYSFVMDNVGDEPHIMILLRLEPGASLDEVLESEGDEGVAEEFESSVAPPGSEGVLTADVGPGDWVLLCPIPDGEGTPHFASGMIHEFTVA